MSVAFASKVEKANTTLGRHHRALHGSCALGALMLALSFAGPVHAEDEKWLGGDGSWFNAGKWNGTAVPNGNVANSGVATPTVIGTGAAGTVTIEGSTPAEARNIQVGNGSKLQIINGGVLNTTPAVNTNAINTIGYSVLGSAPGVMVVDGAGSTWNAGIAGVRAGNGATGTLTVSNGGALLMDKGLLSIGLNAGGNGTLNIDGGSVSNGEAMRVGYGGASGIVNITHGGTLETTTNSTQINTVGNGQGGAATGVVNIAGAGSNWIVGPTGELAIGYSGGTGTVNVTDGGKLEFQNATSIDVGYAGGAGHVLVAGDGSQISSAGGFLIANDADTKGDVTVKDGGSITAEGSVVVGREANADGLEKAKLTIQNGGSVYGKANVSVAEAGAKASAFVTGQGSMLKSDGSIGVGIDVGSDGALTVADGATVKGTFVQVGGAGGKGTLNIGAGAKAGKIDGDIKMAGASSTINFNHNETDYIFTTAINDWTAGVEPAPGTGSVNFIGSGTTTLTAVSNYSSATNIEDGKLVVAAGGSIANSTVNVNDGGTLSGKGTTGGINVKAGGTVSQAANATLSTGAVTFAAGSTYAVGIDDAGHYGSIAGSSATLSGGTVKVVAGVGDYIPGVRYSIITTTGGVTGQFNQVDASQYTFLKAQLDYATDTHKVDLLVDRNSTAFASVAQTANQRSVAAAVDSLTIADPVFLAVVQQDAPGARQAFDALSGEVHASNQSAMISTSLMVSDTLNGRIASSFDRTVKPLRSAAWAQGFGAWMDSEADGNAAKLDATTGGLLAGFDFAAMPNWRVGFAGGYSQTDAGVDARSSSIDTDATYVAAYAGGRYGLFGLQLGGAYSWKDISSKRHVFFPGYDETVSADYNADAAQAFAEVNYRYLDGTGITLLPFAGMSYINLQTDAFEETGNAGLSVAESENNITFSTIGLRGSAFLGKSYGMSFVSRGTLAWRHAFGDTETGFSAALNGSSPLLVGGVPIAEDALFAEAGLDIEVVPDMSVGISWSGQFGNDVTEDQLKGSLLYRW